MKHRQIFQAPVELLVRATRRQKKKPAQEQAPTLLNPRYSLLSVQTSRCPIHTYGRPRHLLVSNKRPRWIHLRLASTLISPRRCKRGRYDAEDLPKCPAISSSIQHHQTRMHAAITYASALRQNHLRHEVQSPQLVSCRAQSLHGRSCAGVAMVWALPFRWLYPWMHVANELRLPASAQPCMRWRVFHVRPPKVHLRDQRKALHRQANVHARHHRESRRAAHRDVAREGGSVSASQ
mmetsp:Transcript_16078/g.26085  ORF Transcript_16078/g.26085 Transcript_16078/m.26085 type:complete len:236 (-) Transcript_16078:1242-1949(-)